MHTDLMETPHGLDVERFAERVMAAALGTFEMYALYLGDSLGWYRALAEHGPLTSAELAGRTGSAERYAREWLEQQAASGWLVHSGERYELPAAHAEVLTDPDSLAFLAPMARFLAAAGARLDSAAQAYRTGGGVSWAEFGAGAREGQAGLNRPLFLHRLTQDVLPGIPGLDAVLRAGARVADIGCGEGWSSVGIALGYPAVTVDGYDLDAPSVAAATRHATGASVADRVRFSCTDAASLAPGSYDVVFAFECVHDLSQPVPVLAAMRSLVRPHGYVIVMDELTQDQFTAPAGPWERLLYGFSLTNCLLDGMSRQPSAGTGAVMRPATLTRYAADAGFARTEILPSPADIPFRFYRLYP